MHGRRPLPPRPVLITFDDGYSSVAEHALPPLRARGFGATVFVVTQRIGETTVLSAADLRALAEDGIEFGAHTRTHARLTELNAEELRDEIEGSRDDLATLLGHAPRAFAYPYGAVDDAVRSAVSTHFDLAFTVREGANRTTTDPHLMRRSGALEEDSPFDLALRTAIGWTPRHRLRQRARRRLGQLRRTFR